MTCKKCGGKMKRGKATGRTMVGGMPDFDGDEHPITFSAGGPGRVIDCLKCVDCGWSCYEPQLKPCPCCDSTDLQFRMVGGHDMGFVKCNNCLVGGTVAAWQTRPDVPESDNFQRGGNKGMTVRQEYKKAAFPTLLGDTDMMINLKKLAYKRGLTAPMFLAEIAGEYADAMLAEDAAHDAEVKL